MSSANETSRRPEFLRAMRTTADMRKEVEKIQEEGIEGVYVDGAKKQPLPTIGEVYGEEYGEVSSQHSRPTIC